MTFWLQTTGAALLAVKRCSMARVQVPAHDGRCAHRLLYLAAVRGGICPPKNGQAPVDTYVSIDGLTAPDAVGASQCADGGWYVAVACTPGVLGPCALRRGGSTTGEQKEQDPGLGGINTTAIHRTVDGGLGINHVTVHVPYFQYDRLG
jgi:hypothetical protein